MSTDTDCTFECETKELKTLLTGQPSDNLRDGFKALLDLAEQLPRPVVCALTITKTSTKPFTPNELAEEVTHLRERAIAAGISADQTDEIIDAVVQGVWDPDLEADDDEDDVS